MNMLYSSGEFPLELLHSELVSFFFAEDAAAAGKAEDAGGAAGVAFARPNAATKLEAMGFRVGFALVERLVRDHPRFATELDALKFICKDFWNTAFTKQVDNLRTNHQGVYVIQDNRFWLLGSFPPSAELREEAAKFLAFPCGLLRGALSNLGVPASVTAQVETIPAVKFHLTIQQK